MSGNDNNEDIIEKFLSIPGVNYSIARTLFDSGYRSIKELEMSNPDELAKALKGNRDLAVKIKNFFTKENQKLSNELDALENVLNNDKYINPSKEVKSDDKFELKSTNSEEDLDKILGLHMKDEKPKTDSSGISLKDQKPHQPESNKSIINKIDEDTQTDNLGLDEGSLSDRKTVITAQNDAEESKYDIPESAEKDEPNTDSDENGISDDYSDIAPKELMEEKFDVDKELKELDSMLSTPSVRMVMKETVNPDEKDEVTPELTTELKSLEQDLVISQEAQSSQENKEVKQIQNEINQRNKLVEKLSINKLYKFTGTISKTGKIEGKVENKVVEGQFESFDKMPGKISCLLNYHGRIHGLIDDKIKIVGLTDAQGNINGFIDNIHIKGQINEVFKKRVKLIGDIDSKGRFNGIVHGKNVTGEIAGYRGQGGKLKLIIDGQISFDGYIDGMTKIIGLINDKGNANVLIDGQQVKGNIKGLTESFDKDEGRKVEEKHKGKKMEAHEKVKSKSSDKKKESESKPASGIFTSIFQKRKK